MPTNVLIPNVSIDERIGSVFNYLFHIINDSERSEDETVEWNFKDASFFHPFFLAPLAIYKHRCGKKIHCINNPQNISDYFSTIAFHKPLIIQAESDIKALLEPYKHKTYTPICAFRASEEKVADELQSVLQVLIENQTNYDSSVKTPLSYLLSEIICNVNQHSCSKYGYIFAQYLRKEGCIDICIADDGITVYGSYIKNLKSATKLFSVLLASKRPLITELADKLRLKYPLLPTISPCPTMRLEAIRSIIPISCRRYPKSV